jgi:hypothetical protein
MCISLVTIVLGTTLKGLLDDSRLPQRRRGIVTKKTDFVRFFRLYGNAATLRSWLAVRVRLHAVIQDRHFNLVSCTLIQTFLRDRRPTMLIIQRVVLVYDG